MYDARDGFAQSNPGYGDLRFAPFDEVATGARVPTLYLAESLAAALLETALHGVHERMPRVVSEQSLLGKLHAHVIPPTSLTLADLRDAQLARLGLGRAQIASASAEHYPCTRRVARTIHAEAPDLAGIVWHSRQAELVGGKPVEVAVIFAGRLPAARDAWKLGPYRNASGSLLEGAGRLLLDELAEELGVIMLPDLDD
ncbi:RES domain-containing protein [Gulosibacter molinativorax]|uniref:RES domain-containing protein n=1 Tax=Gulosibacter molinativorax TaxID=256821 RepID=UPI002480679B|nr:RES domain-containing protein [Gulosibacter molinativorax]